MVEVMWLSQKGEIVLLVGEGLNELLEAPLPEYDPDKIEMRVKYAISKYRNRHSKIEERREAVRVLADVLEYIRPRLKKIISKKDENELFNIANNFAIRHHNEIQKLNYDPSWLSWMFYLYLSTIHLYLRLFKRMDSI